MVRFAEIDYFGDKDAGFRDHDVDGFEIEVCDLVAGNVAHAVDHAKEDPQFGLKGYCLLPAGHEDV